MDIRKAALANWFQALMPSLGLTGSALGDSPADALQTVSGDASFRRYFRAHVGEHSLILVDAPPNQEDCRPFLRVAKRFLALGVDVPRIYAADVEQGFMCLSDLGNCLYYQPLREAESEVDPAMRQARVGALYQQAVASLLLIQGCPRDVELPDYDGDMLDREMALFRDWLCEGLLGMALQSWEKDMLNRTFAALRQSALAQPQVCVHRDYHCRNLMYRPGQAPGVIDFQDAVWGPVTYDLVSLLKDCYISWPREWVRQWALAYREAALEVGIGLQAGPEDFLRDFDLMGVQRHLKASGIFARLWQRDGKPAYLADIPRTLNYVQTVSAEHPFLAAFHEWLETRLVPLLPQVASLASEAGRTTGTDGP